MSTKVTTGRSAIGFGCPNVIDPHHFVVDIPTDRKRPVLITENYGIRAKIGYELVERCSLPRPIWTTLAETVQREFNRRLREKHLAPSRWRVGEENKVERLLGKELVILAWAVERADRAVVWQALRNWSGLKPEERWWLYTMTAAATGGIDDAGKGWRQALYHILVENPLREGCSVFNQVTRRT